MSKPKRSPKTIDKSNGQWDVFAEIFLEEMAIRTGCSRLFLEKARPTVERLYRELDGERLERSLDELRAIITDQAAVERACADMHRAVQQIANAGETLLENARALQTARTSPLTPTWSPPNPERKINCPSAAAPQSSPPSRKSAPQWLPWFPSTPTPQA